MKLLVLALVLVALNAAVIPFDNTAIEKIFQEKKSALFLFIGDQTQDAEVLNTFKAFDETNPDIILTVSSETDGHGLFERLAEYLGVDTSATPKVLYLSDKTEKYRFAGDITVERLGTFVAQIAAGKISPFFKSAPIPDSNDANVKVVVGTTFKEYVLDSDKEVLVKFYAPWCGHCKTIAPHYEEAARRISNNPNILLIEVDSTENEVAAVNVEGFPTLKFWGKDKSAEPIDFDGDRTADGIIDWLKAHTQYEWVEPLGFEDESADAEEVAPDEL